MLRILGPTSVPNSVNDMACCVISFTALTDLISWYRTIDSLSLPLSLPLSLSLYLSLSLSLSLSLYSDGFEVDSAGPGRTALASPRARGSCHRGSRHRPRVSGAPRKVRLMASVMIMFIPKFFGLPETPLAHNVCIADGSPNNQHI